MFLKVSFILIFIFTIFLNISKNVFAQAAPVCNNSIVQIDVDNDPGADPLYTDTPRAKFTIDIGNNNEPGVNNWRVSFLCSANPTPRNASKHFSGKNIDLTLDNSGGMCEFASSNNPFENSPIVQVMVIAETDAGNRDRCIATYQVINRDNLCELNLNPDKGITFTTPLEIIGSNLSTNGNYALFVDNNPIGVDIVNLNTGGYRVRGPNFTRNIQALPIGRHIVSLRTRNNKPPPILTGLVNFIPVLGPIAGNIAGAGDIPSYFNGPACVVNFNVGTAAQPGSVISSSSVGSGRPRSPSTPATSGVKSLCQGDDTQIRTAIGCINTNPVKFIQDILRFAIGIAGGIAFLFMIGGVFQILTSAGNPDALKSGQGILTNAVIGLMFLIFSTLLLKIIGVDILNFGQFF